MRWSVAGSGLLVTTALLLPVRLHAGMDQDAEAGLLRQRFESLSVVGAVMGDDLNRMAERRVTGPVTMGPGAKSGDNAADKAASFPEDRSEALCIYYGVVLPRRARLSLDFRTNKLPRDHNFMTMCSAGTAGNTKFMVRLGLDRRVSVYCLTPREQIVLLSDPVDLGKWHHLEWWYAPEGSLLKIDGTVHDYSTDYCVPYAVEVGEAFWLGDQPWWDDSGKKGVFYPLDNFVGLMDNLELVGLK